MFFLGTVWNVDLLDEDSKYTRAMIITPNMEKAAILAGVHFHIFLPLECGYFDILEL
jgi:hypothetical protein